MGLQQILVEIKNLSFDDKAKLVTSIVKEIFSTEHWQDYYYKYFYLWEASGFHITANRYYSPIPDVGPLIKNIWKNIPDLPYINFNERAQVDLLHEFSLLFRSECLTIPIDNPSNPDEYYLNNNSFAGVDGYVLYCIIRRIKPKRIIEIGSGFSTTLAAQACQKNLQEGHPSSLIAIEPHPSENLKKGFPGLSQLITKEVQNVEIDLFKSLEPGDILFIDSSHILKLESDVKYEYTKIIPALQKDVLIHIHDIFLPAEYPKMFILGQLFFFNEQYLVEALLSNTDSFNVVWSSSYMHMKYKDEMAKAFPEWYEFMKGEHLPGSLWLRKTRNTPLL